MKSYAHIASPLGRMLLIAQEDKLIGSYFPGQDHFPLAATWGMEQPHLPIFRLVQRQLEEFFVGQRQEFSVPYLCLGTPFQIALWREIARIPYGQTASYSHLASALARPNAARAVGAATGRNPLSWIIPCHRVVGKQGALTGYAGGLSRKQTLLNLEQGTTFSLGLEKRAA